MEETSFPVPWTFLRFWKFIPSQIRIIIQSTKFSRIKKKKSKKVWFRIEIFHFDNLKMFNFDFAHFKLENLVTTGNLNFKTKSCFARKLVFLFRKYWNETSQQFWTFFQTFLRLRNLLKPTLPQKIFWFQQIGIFVKNVSLKNSSELWRKLLKLLWL